MQKIYYDNAILSLFFVGSLLFKNESIMLYPLLTIVTGKSVIKNNNNNNKYLRKVQNKSNKN